MAKADATICHLRSNWSAMAAASSGPNGAAMAMMKVYSQAAGDGDAALDQQGRHPVGEAVEADGLEQMKDDQHDAAGAVRRPPHFGEAAARRRWARALSLRVLREPAGAFGDAEADPPDQDRTSRAE